MDWSLCPAQLGKVYIVNKEIRITAQLLRADLCNFRDAYIVLKGDITVTEPNDAKGSKNVTFKNNALFIKKHWCTNWQCRRSRCNVNVQFAWIQQNYRKTTGSLWNYYRDETSNPLSSNSESFKYKTSITINTYNLDVSDAGYDVDRVCKNKTESVITLKHYSSFGRFLNIPLINCYFNLV